MDLTKLIQLLFSKFCTLAYRNSDPDVFCKKVFLEVSQNSQENIYGRVSFLIKTQAWGLQFIEKETLTQVLTWIL